MVRLGSGSQQGFHVSTVGPEVSAGPWHLLGKLCSYEEAAQIYPAYLGGSFEWLPKLVGMHHVAVNQAGAVTFSFPSQPLEEHGNVLVILVRHPEPIAVRPVDPYLAVWVPKILQTLVGLDEGNPGVVDAV